MKIFEVTMPAAARVMALTQLLKGRAQDMAVDNVISVDSFIKLAQDFGLPVTRETLPDLLEDPPFNNIIVSIKDEQIHLAGLDTFGEIEPTENDKDDAQDHVASMAKRQLKK